MAQSEEGEWGITREDLKRGMNLGALRAVVLCWIGVIFILGVGIADHYLGVYFKQDIPPTPPTRVEAVVLTLMGVLFIIAVGVVSRYLDACSERGNTPSVR